MLRLLYKLARVVYNIPITGPPLRAHVCGHAGRVVGSQNNGRVLQNNGRDIQNNGRVYRTMDELNRTTGELYITMEELYRTMGPLHEGYCLRNPREVHETDIWNPLKRKNF